MNQLDEARAHLSKYEKEKGNIQGLTHLSTGIRILSDVLAEDCTQWEKTTATNQGRTYRRDVVEWCHELLLGKVTCSVEMDMLDYCSLALECFSDINLLIAQDKKYELLEKKLSGQAPEPKEAKIMKKDLIDGLLRLSEDERNRAYSLLARLEIHIQEAVEKEKKRRLKTTRDALTQEQQSEGILQEGDLHIYSVHNAKAMMVRKAGAYIILKDSTAIRQEKDSLPDNARRRRRELIASGVLVQDPDRNLLRFTKDVVFDSPSAASCTVSACSTDGWKCFKINH